MEKRPSLSVTTTRCKPVPVCVTVMVAPGRGAYVLSVTTPTMDDEADSWAPALAPTATSTITVRVASLVNIHFLLVRTDGIASHAL